MKHCDVRRMEGMQFADLMSSPLVNKFFNSTILVKKFVEILILLARTGHLISKPHLLKKLENHFFV